MRLRGYVSITAVYTDYLKHFGRLLDRY